LEPSISVNAWTDTEQTALVEEMFGVELPLHKAVNPKKLEIDLENVDQVGMGGLTAGISFGLTVGISKQDMVGWTTLYTIASVLAQCKLTATNPILFVKELLHHRYGTLLYSDSLRNSHHFDTWKEEATVCTAAMQEAMLLRVDGAAVNLYARPSF
jgi:hypothetical protein